MSDRGKEKADSPPTLENKEDSPEESGVKSGTELAASKELLKQLLREVLQEERGSGGLAGAEGPSGSGSSKYTSWERYSGIALRYGCRGI